ncbi:UvrD-helicase domain-containing protein [Chromobacterium alticapitis]|uniref:DNA 3'-5' helicase n=1 Tax=Chromobacterium alticapitis TaxID=2073169 RepID=A0A2S5DG53_9NEIS|nr:ATP-dependent helicase [Chromobacterium alticapitis]POZ62063.1 hypothetical protein C2I19_10420 [Chromobacterium alticapitis]
MSTFPSAEQQDILNHQRGNLLIEAAAGSGKTTILAHLAAQYAGIGEQVLVLTFSQSGKAAFEERLKAISGSGNIAASTFGEYCLAASRRHLPDDKYLANLEWVLENIIPSLISTLNRSLADLGHEQLATDEEGARDLIDTIQRIKNGRLQHWLAEVSDPEEIEDAIERPYSVWLAFFEYEKLRNSYAFQHNGRKHLGFRLLEDVCHDLLDAADNNLLDSEGGFQQAYVFIDEFHDTTPLQLDWIKAWSRRNKRVVVVGDRDQELYFWRGANAQTVFQKFRERFAPVTILPLSSSYRFGPLLAQRCQALRGKGLAPLSGQGGPTRIIASRAELASLLRTAALPLAHTAILARDRSQTIASQLALAENDIPFYTLDKWPCWRNREGRLIQMLAQLIDPSWRLYSLRQIEQEPRKREFEARRCAALAQSLLSLPGWSLTEERKNGCLAEAISPANLKMLFSLLIQEAPPAHEPMRSQGLRLYQALQCLLDSPAQQPLANTLTSFAQACKLEAMLQSFTPRGEAANSRWHSWQALLAYIRAKNFSASGWLQHCNKLDQMHHKTTSKNIEQALAVGSVFHAKGKEWEHVILTGLAEQDFPLRQAPLQEERQRAYVAATRARSLLTLHCDAAKNPSRFFKQLNGE